MSEIMKEVFAWIDWKDICDIKKCSKENIEILNNYGDKVLKRHIDSFSFGNLKPCDFMPGTAFSIFEMHAIKKLYGKNDEKAGKTYKEGLFYISGENVKDKIGLLKNYFKLYLREAIRYYYSEDIKQDASVSLNNPIKSGEDEAAGEYIDLLADTLILDNEVNKEEIFKIAQKYSEIIFSVMSFEHKSIILAISLNLSYSTSEALQKVTKMSKSTLWDHYQRITSKQFYMDIIKKDFPNEPDEILKELYGLAIYLLAGERIILWGRPEIRCKPLFKESERRKVNGD